MAARRLYLARTPIFRQGKGWQERSRKAVSLQENHGKARSPFFCSDCTATAGSQEKAHSDTGSTGTAGVFDGLDGVWLVRLENARVFTVLRQ